LIEKQNFTVRVFRGQKLKKMYPNIEQHVVSQEEEPFTLEIEAQPLLSTKGAPTIRYGAETKVPVIPGESQASLAIKYHAEAANRRLCVVIALSALMMVIVVIVLLKRPDA
jgi:hypothetical protein